MADSKSSPATPATLRGNPAMKWMVLAGALTVALVWFGQRRLLIGGADSGAPAGVKSVLHLEPFVVNLSDPDEKAYLRVGIDLGLTEEMKRDGEGVPTALVRDTLLGVLTNCAPGELLTADGKEKLRQRLLQALHKRAPGLGVTEIYFTEFLIQR